MPRGIPKDPEARKAQLARLAAGRRIAEERRAAGLPTKASETRRRSRVVKDDYTGPKPAPPGKPSGKKPATPGKPKPATPGKRKPAKGGSGAATETTPGTRGRDVLGTLADIIGAR